MFRPIHNPSRPIIVPQEYLVFSEDLFLEDGIHQNITETFHPIPKLVTQPKGPNQTTCYHTLVKKEHSYNELMFIISHLVVHSTTTPKFNHKTPEPTPPPQGNSSKQKFSASKEDKEMATQKHIWKLLRSLATFGENLSAFIFGAQL